MKLSGRDAISYCKRPDPKHKATLIFGQDIGYVSSLKDQLVSALLSGMAQDTEIVDLAPDELRRDPLKLDEALQSQGLFASQRLVIVQNATDALSKSVTPSLARLEENESHLILTAGQLAARSSLRKAFEANFDTVSLQTFEAQIDRDTILPILRSMNESLSISNDDLESLIQVGRGMDYAAFLKSMEIVAIYAAEHSKPITMDEILKLLPLDRDAEIDAVVATVADGNAEEIGPTLRRLAGSGVTPVSVLIALQRHFRMLFMIVASGGNLAAVKPPLWGSRRDSVQRQLNRWSAGRLETANTLLLETDASVRSSGRPPEFALIERCALRLAMMAKRG